VKRTQSNRTRPSNVAAPYVAGPALDEPVDGIDQEAVGDGPGLPNPSGRERRWIGGLRLERCRGEGQHRDSTDDHGSTRIGSYPHFTSTDR
jgi:hypothetical protein